jgi:hypothetical protein
MDPHQVADEANQPSHTNGSAANPDDVERVKGKWGEELNTAFQYEKYTGQPSAGGAQWAATALRYEWQDDLETDDIAPRDERLEKDLFGDDSEANMGINFDKYVYQYLIS